jgi:hypothetical protein
MSRRSLHLAFVLKNALVADVFSGSPPADRRQPVPTEALGKSQRVFRLSKAEHYEVNIICAKS